MYVRLSSLTRMKHKVRLSSLTRVKHKIRLESLTRVKHNVRLESLTYGGRPRRDEYGPTTATRASGVAPTVRKESKGKATPGPPGERDENVRISKAANGEGR